MTGKRKRYGVDFKAKVALEALRGELTATQLAANTACTDDGSRLETAGSEWICVTVLWSNRGEGQRPGR
jgi:hypothetical protein